MNKKQYMKSYRSTPEYKEHHNEYQKQWAKTHPDKIKRYAEEWRKSKRGEIIYKNLCRQTIERRRKAKSEFAEYNLL